MNDRGLFEIDIFGQIKADFPCNICTEEKHEDWGTSIGRSKEGLYRFLLHIFRCNLYNKF